MFNAVLNAIFCVFGMVLLKILLGRAWAAAIVAIAFFTFTSTRSLTDYGPFGISLLTSALVIAIIVITIQRLGLLSTIVLFLASFILGNAAITLDTSRWFFGDAMLPVALTAAVAVYGVYVSRGGEPLFGRRLLD